jgi:2-dehydro-3-deoxyglucarate aldolase/4-hydroxy-2-oxoheptanedioate aldolase
MRPNPLLAALRRGEVQYGCGFGTLRTGEFLRVLAAAGFQWCFVDGEHGSFDLETIADLCQIGPLVGISPLVRVGEAQYTLVARALDAGAAGVVFPRIEDPETLRRAITWAKFPPEGVRGYGLSPVNYDYQTHSIADVIAHRNSQQMVVMQIETARGLEACDEILSVPGVDALMVGPADLSISLGVPGDFQHPKMVAAMERLIESCRRHGVIPGTQTRNTQLARFWKERGMLLLGCSNDTSMLIDRASQIIRELNA